MAAPVFRSLVLTSSHVPIRSSTFTTTWAVAKVAPVRVRARSTAAINQRAFVISTLLSFALGVGSGAMLGADWADVKRDHARPHPVWIAAPSSVTPLLWLEYEVPRLLRVHTHHRFKRPVTQPVIEHPQRCRMSDEHHPLPIALGGELCQEALHPHRDLRVTLPMREGLADRRRAGDLHFRTWTPFEIPIVALAQPGILQDGDRAACKDEARSIIGTLGIGR